MMMGLESSIRSLIAELGSFSCEKFTKFSFWFFNKISPRKFVYFYFIMSYLCLFLCFSFQKKDHRLPKRDGFSFVLGSKVLFIALWEVFLNKGTFWRNMIFPIFSETHIKLCNGKKKRISVLKKLMKAFSNRR